MTKADVWMIGAALVTHAVVLAWLAAKVAL